MHALSVSYPIEERTLSFLEKFPRLRELSIEVQGGSPTYSHALNRTLVRLSHLTNLRIHVSSDGDFCHSESEDESKEAADEFELADPERKIEREEVEFRTFELCTNLETLEIQDLLLSVTCHSRPLPRLTALSACGAGELFAWRLEHTLPKLRNLKFLRLFLYCRRPLTIDYNSVLLPNLEVST